MDNKYIKIIKGTPLFHGMSDEEIAQFLRPDGSGIKSFRKESYIFHAGDKTAYFGILLEGKALIERDELWGGRSIIAPLEAGQLFGEVYACTGEPLGVSVCAKEQCTVLFLSPESIIKESSTLTARLLKITAMKNLRLNEKIQVITPRTIRALSCICQSAMTELLRSRLPQAKRLYVSMRCIWRRMPVS